MRVCLVAQVVVVGWVMGTGALAGAQSRNAVDAAKAHFKAGEALYDAGEYADAVREWSEGYDIAPRAAFLVNLGQAYRKMKNWPKAAEYFQHYLTVTRADDPRRGEVNELLAEMQRLMAPPAAPSAPAPSPPPPAASSPTASPSRAAASPAASPAPPPLGRADVEPTPAVAAPPSALVTPTPPRERSFVRRNWWLIPAGAVVVGAVVGVSVYYGTRPSSRFDCSGTISCIDTTAARAP